MSTVTRLASCAFNLKTIAAALLAALLCAQAVAQQGQTAARPDRGVNTGGAYSASDVESISLQNGNVNLAIPLASLPPIAGGKLSLSLRAHYNSKIWNVVREERQEGFPAQRFVVDKPQLNDGGGWKIDARYYVDFREALEDFAYQIPSSLEGPDYYRLTQNRWWKVIVRTPDGAEHELRPTGSGFLTYGGADYPRTYLWGFHTAKPTAATGPIRYETTDGTYVSAVHNPPGHASGIRWTLFMPDGTQVIDYSDGVQRIRDTNGNSIKIFTDATGTHYQDEHLPEREIRVEYNPAGGNGYGQNRVWYRTVGGVWQHVDVNYGATEVQGKVYKISDWNPTGHSETGQQGVVCQRHQLLAPQTISVIREIVFPATEPNTDARRFTFSYNSDQTETATTQQFYSMCSTAPEPLTRTASRGMGALSQMVTPTGAQVDYDYTLASTHDFTGLLTADRLTRETIVVKELTYKDAAGSNVTDRWEYEIPYDGVGTTSTVGNPDGSTSTISYYQRHPDFPRGAGTGDLLSGQVFYTNNGLTTTHKRWNMRGTAHATGTDSFTAANPFVEAEYTTLMENNVPVKMTAKTFEHDYNGNVTKVTEYDWFDPASVQREQGTGIPTDVPSGAKVLRVTDTSYHNQAADANSTHYYRNRALTSGTPSILVAVKETTTGAARTRFSYDGQTYGAAPTAGNVTKVSRRDDRGDADAGNDTEVETSATYGAYGNSSTATDANGNVTQLFYDDETHALPTRVVTDPLNGTGAQTTITAYDKWTGLVTSATDPNGQLTTVDYTNRLLNAVDPFGRPGMTRSPAGTAAGGATLYRKVYTFYEDAARRLRTESDLKTEGDGLLKSRTTSDELGRILLAEKNEGGSSYTISSRTVYAQAGRVTLQSSPAQNSQPESWSRTTRDVYGRVVESATFGGAAQPSATAAANTIANWTGSVTTTYTANTKTITDQAGRKRRTVADAMGRLVRVDEPDKGTGVLDDGSGNPVQPTSYEYDTMGNLRKVVQGGQLRFFLYDSLSRLIRAKNPEQGSLATDADFPLLTDSAFGNPGGQWSMGYLYDAVGNLKKQKDARGVVATYGYDGLNRNTTLAYTIPGGSGVAATPNVTRVYDTGVRGKGQLYQVAQSGSTTSTTFIDEYDAAGHPLVQRQKFETAGVWSADYTVSHTYDLAGNLKTQTYPSGRTVNYTYDDAGRLSTLTGNLGGGAARTYADTFAYDAEGRIRQERFGTQTPLYNKRLYNSRGQLAEIRLGTASLPDTGWQRGAVINHFSISGWGATGGGPDNNGSLKKQDIFVPKVEGAGYDQGGNYELFSQDFSYDQLNRLSRVAESWGGAERWAQKFDYDRWGNRTIDHVNSYIVPQPQFSVDAATNRLGAPSGQSGQMGYDAAGNLTLDTYQGGANVGGGTRAYDAENRMTAAQFVAGQTQTAAYIYDGDGRRVRRAVGTASEAWQVYGMSGELLAEYAPHTSPSQPLKEYGYRGSELLVLASPSSAPGVSTEAVTWTNVVGASASGSTLTKTAAAGWGNAGASSAQSITAGDGYVEFTVSQAYVERVCGLSLGDTDRGHADIDFGIILSDGGYVYAWESGVPKANAGAYTVGDRLRVAVEGGAVKYYKNGTLFHTSTTTPTYPLLVDAAFNTAGSTLSEVVISGSLASAAAVSWADMAGVTASGGSLTKTAAIGWGNAGGSSAQTAASGSVYVEFTATADQTDRVCGLGRTAATRSISDIDFGILLSDGGYAYAMEGGTVRANGGAYSTGDRLRVSVEGGTVRYYKNGTLFYTSTVAPTYPLRAAASLYQQGAVLGDVTVWVASAVQTAAEVRWLVTDQLGTPRMVVDQTGSLTGVSRHDYLPFGEELGAGAAGRTVGQGYSKFDGNRRKWAQLEKDEETSLDYAINRYYSSTQGRFTSVDPENTGAYAGNPQTWNGYAYANNRPTVFTDPDGLDTKVCNLDGQCQVFTDDQANAGLFNKKWQRENGHTVKRGKVFQNGEQIGTYENINITGAPYSGVINEVGRRPIARTFTYLYLGSVVGGLSTPASSGLMGLRLFGEAFMIVKPPGGTIDSGPYLGGTISGNTGSLTANEQRILQDIAREFNTDIDVVGSRGAGRGRNIDSNLPAGKGPNTKSDIDLRIDGDVDIRTSGRLSDAIKNRLPHAQIVGHSMLSRPPFIRIGPKRK